MLKDLIGKMAKALVDHPDQVQVSETVTGNGMVFELKVAKEDLGQVIGKQGKMVDAMRTILTPASATAKTKKHITLEIAD